MSAIAEHVRTTNQLANLLVEAHSCFPLGLSILTVSLRTLEVYE